jgi:hypothetical protein
MRYEIEDLIKGMVLLKGRIEDEKYKSLYKELGKEVEEVLPYVEVQEEDELLRMYLKRRWGIGGRKAVGCIGVLRGVRGIEKRIGEELGEVFKGGE